MPAEPTAHFLGGTREEILEQRAESLALESAEEEASDRVSMLLFRIGEEWYAVDVADVREIFQEYKVTPIPCTPEFILGVTNVRGEILSVTDPAILMSLGRIEGGEDDVAPAAVVITDHLVATALVVDEIGDIVEVASNSVEPPVASIDRTQAEFVAGTLFVDGLMVGLLNVERILEPVGASSRH
jgi:purine-binding chemotaxis protein CheW